jgi:hypothetical protein
MDKYFSFDGTMFETHATAEAAANACLRALDEARDNSGDDCGWPGWTDQISWGVLCGVAIETSRKTPEDLDRAGEGGEAARCRRQGWDHIVDYELVAVEGDDVQPSQNALVVRVRELFAVFDRKCDVLAAETGERGPAGWEQCWEIETTDEADIAAGAPIIGEVVLWCRREEDLCAFVGRDVERGAWWAVHFGPFPLPGQAVRTGRASSQLEAIEAANAAAREKGADDGR